MRQGKQQSHGALEQCLPRRGAWNPAEPDQPRSEADFEASYDYYHAIIFGTALRLVHNHDEAADITQQVFLKIWAAPLAFRGGNFAAWLKVVTRNYAISALRTRGARSLDLLLTEPASAAISAATNVEDEVIRSQVIRSVRAALACLKPTERVLILAAFMEEQTHHDIASESSIPLGTVKTRIRTGLRRMREHAAHLQDVG